ncbi:uncharacterized protein BJ212DRAFT_1483602 [Suillus subaureus]|uniref:Uncharacterized protein n=1 Tax=Suillus subaureus TaxID=48587 RepID=A0A9P7E5L6_9AGAM|nr:uncharacterized protein BJ212DRAFT_1483602 [Suillus subaureus]KAG1811899.1 hypothetical protein BJ212DRAFT_1483602 [Suillus subaureus]
MSEPELTNLILSLAQALREPDLSITHILFTSHLESHISNAFQNKEVHLLVWEIPMRTSGEGGIILLDGADIDNNICTFLWYSFRELESRHPNFPQPLEVDLVRLASQAGRHFIMVSMMMKFIIDNEDKDPHDRLQLMLKLTSELLPGTEVYKLYDCILSTCADPMWAYLHLSIVATLTDPLPISQISTLLGPGLGRDMQTMLIQLRSVMNIPTDISLPVNVYHSSIRDYVSDPSNCSLPEVHSMSLPHSLLADASLHLMMKEIQESTALLDALSELEKQSNVMQPEDPHRLKDSLVFLVQQQKPLFTILAADLGGTRLAVEAGSTKLAADTGKTRLATGAGRITFVVGLWKIILVAEPERRNAADPGSTIPVDILADILADCHIPQSGPMFHHIPMPSEPTSGPHFISNSFPDPLPLCAPHLSRIDSTPDLPLSSGPPDPHC